VSCRTTMTSPSASSPGANPAARAVWGGAMAAGVQAAYV